VRRRKLRQSSTRTAHSLTPDRTIAEPRSCTPTARLRTPDRYCGGGSLKRCRRVLRRSLRAALKVPASELYGGDPVCPNADQWCFDAVRFSPVGGTSQPLIHWINRPTYQQVNEIQRRLPR
jgi:hypothetical protein